MPTGSLVDVAAINNLRLDQDFVRQAGSPFDSRFGRTGGCDTLFTRSVVALGGRPVRRCEAIVDDGVPSQRISHELVSLRAFRNLNSWSRVELEIVPPGPWRTATRLGLLARGTIRVAGGVAKLIAGELLRQESLSVRTTYTAARPRNPEWCPWPHLLGTDETVAGPHSVHTHLLGDSRTPNLPGLDSDKETQRCGSQLGVVHLLHASVSDATSG